MYGLMNLGWGYGELCGLFLIMSMVAGTDLSANGALTNGVTSFIDSAKTVVWGCILTGVAKGIMVVMQDAQIADTVIYYLSDCSRMLRNSLSAQLMLIVQTLISCLIPSATGQAATTMPIMSQLADISELQDRLPYGIPVW